MNKREGVTKKLFSMFCGMFWLVYGETNIIDERREKSCVSDVLFILPFCRIFTAFYFFSPFIFSNFSLEYL